MLPFHVPAFWARSALRWSSFSNELASTAGAQLLPGARILHVGRAPQYTSFSQRGARTLSYPGADQRLVWTWRTCQADVHILHATQSTSTCGFTRGPPSQPDLMPLAVFHVRSNCGRNRVCAPSATQVVHSSRYHFVSRSHFSFRCTLSHVALRSLTRLPQHLGYGQRLVALWWMDTYQEVCPPWRTTRDTAPSLI